MPSSRRTRIAAVTAAFSLVLATLGVAASTAASASGPAAPAATGWSASPSRVPAVVAAALAAAPKKKVVGTGTAKSCTYAKLAKAVKSGGHISFNCGPNPVTIVVKKTLYTCNTTNCKHGWQGGKRVKEMVLNGGGKVTLSGDGKRGIFYANTCKESFGWLSDRCDREVYPHITFKNITFTKGNATKAPAGFESVGGGGGGGAIAMRGGRLTVKKSTFTGNKCMKSHSDAGGGAIRVVGMRKAVRIYNSTITKNKCANGGGVSSLGAPMLIKDSIITKNTATGKGASSGKGGNGGGVYFDGGKQNVRLERTTVSGNKAPEGGPGVFYVSNDKSGHLRIWGSKVVKNTGQRFHTAPYKNIFYIGKGKIQVKKSTID